MPKQPLEVDASEFMALLDELADEKALRQGLRSGIGRAMRIVTRAVMQAAKQSINFNRAGTFVRSRQLGGALAWRKPLYKDVYQFVWRRELGATSGLFAQKGKPNRAWILRILDRGTGERWTKGNTQRNRKRAYRGSIEARGFYARGVNSSYRQALDKLGVYTVEGLRKIAAKRRN